MAPRVEMKARPSPFEAGQVHQNVGRVVNKLDTVGLECRIVARSQRASMAGKQSTGLRGYRSPCPEWR